MNYENIGVHSYIQTYLNDISEWISSLSDNPTQQGQQWYNIMVQEMNLTKKPKL